MESSGNFVTETNKAPLVETLTLFFVSSAIICTLCRLYTKWVVITVASVDDYFVPVSMVRQSNVYYRRIDALMRNTLKLFLIGQSVAVTVMTTNGYGRPSAELSSAQMSTILKAQYTAMLLYIPSLLFSKLPTLVILNVVSPKQRFRKLLLISALVIMAWAGSSELVSAFQCQPLRTWDFVNGRCMNRVAFYMYFEVMNGLTDLILVLLPIILVANINTSIYRRLHVISVFCIRLMGVGAVVAKLVLLMSEKNDDPFFATWPATICTQLIQFLSLLSACVLYLRPFLEALTSGFINGDDLRRRGQIKPYLIESGLMDPGSSSYELTSAISRSKGRADFSETQPTSKPGFL
ncbi:hypothetical protein MMC10_005559 [Thelotrema lepadinum]|nr:hypothetical protein [Thelotrema lepadinum]